MTTFNSSTNMCNSFMKCTEDVQPAANFFATPPSLVLGLRSSSFTATSSAVDSHTYLHSQKNISNFDHHLSSSTSHIQTRIKREPCQVSEVTTSNCYHSNKPNSELVSPSMPTTVKIEATSPNTTEMDLSPVNKKIPHDSTMDASALHPPKDVNCFGIRAADMGAVASNCGNVFFTGAEMFSGANTEDLSNCVNRSAPTFWQYPNTFQIESLISMPPVELQYSRDNRGQLVFMPAAPALDPFQQPAFLWPPFVQQNAASTLQPHTNFLFPSISSQTSSQYQSYQGPLQLLGPNYLPTVASATTSTLCQQSQTTDHRFASITTGTKEIEKYQKFDTVRGEDWNVRCNILNKNSSEIHCTAIDKVKLFHESKFLEVPTDTNEDGSKPIVRYGKSQILLHNTNTPTEFQNMPIFSPNFIAPQNPTTITQNVSVEACKSTCLSTVTYPETTKMQDADIQTDTPACSEDELTSEVCPPEALSFGDQTRKDPSTGSNPLSIRNAEASQTNLQEKDSSEPLETQTMVNDFSRQEIFKSPNPRVFEENCPVESPLRNSDNIESSLQKQTNNPLLEMSGLELLSNISTGSFVKANSIKPVCIKKEPYDIDVNNEPCEPNNECKSQEKKMFDNSKCSHNCNESYGQNLKHTCIQNAEGSLGGLNLLCALAEQRIQEEVESNNYLNTAEKSISAEKSRKHKRSKAKSGKKSHSKKNRKSKNRDKKEYVKPLWLKSKYDYVHEQRSALKRSDPNYRKFNKYSNPEDFFKTMESDMRLRLADITRQYRRKKRKLDEISKQERKNKKIRLAEYKFANISCKNPNFICLLDKIQSPLKMPTSSSEASEIHHLVMHSKSTSERRVESRESNEGSCIEKEVNYSEFDIRSSQKSTTTSQGSYCIDQQTCNPKLFSKSNKHLARSMLAEKCQIQTTLTKTQNKVSAEIDKELVLTSQHLYQKETRVLTDMGGLFYAGILKPLQPPDVYAVTLDGERGNKSHIMSREEILKDTILELAPKSILNVPPGTRLCAYWSQQYRCLYPGRVIQTEHTDADSDFVSVEFDDGDSGRIRLQNIRFLLSDYPIVEYNENPFNPHGKNKLQTVSKYASVKTINVKSNQEESCPESLIRNVSPPDLHINEPVKSCTLSEHEHKHKKHKKRKKHKKIRSESLTKLAASVHTGAAEETTMKIRDNTPRKHKDRQKQNEESKKHKREVTQSCLPLTSATESPITPDPCDEKSIVNASVEAPNEVKPKRKSETSGKGSKIAAFLPERQLWRWLGNSYRKVGTKGKARKQFYKSITRGKETITVGECAVFLSAGRPDRPYIGRIEAMWETMSSNKVVRVRWFYHPEETTGCPKLKYPNALFDSPHEDENDVQTISHRCEVIQFSVYIAKHESNAKHFQSIYNYNDTYYLSGYYNPRLQDLKLNPDIPIETDDSL